MSAFLRPCRVTAPFMNTLAQLKAGQLAGIQRLDLSCGLTEFPGKSSNWPTHWKSSTSAAMP